MELPIQLVNLALEPIDRLLVLVDELLLLLLAVFVYASLDSAYELVFFVGLVSLFSILHDMGLFVSQVH